MRWLTALPIVLVACGPTKARPDGGSGSHGDAPASTIDADPTPFVDASCGAQMANIGVVNLGDPPDLLVVLDRSGSMSSPPEVFPPVFTSKWAIMKSALTTVSTAKDMQIKFGLLEFPSDDNCAVDAVAEVPVALGAHIGIGSYFQGHSPNGNTPAHLALDAALTYFAGIPVNPAGRYVLFATDGLPNCAGGDPNTASNAETVAAVTALFNSGIKTFVLGFGSFANPTVLNDAATAGGEARSGTTKFYEANSASDLDAALATIAGGIIVPTCSFALASLPPVPDAVTVTINGVAVPRSTMHTDGWDYSPNASTITFFGSYCTEIQGGASSAVNFAYGCPGPVIN